MGTAEGEIKEPNGIAINAAGEIYVTDAFNHKLVKYDANGKFVKEGVPEGGFYGPRDIVIGPNKQLYVIDQGLTRIAKFDPVSESFTVWGAGGSSDGQFNEATGIAIVNDMVYVADAGNQRIQVFDLNGTFVKQWPVLAWDPKALHYPDIAFDDVGNRLFVTSGKTNQLLAFDLDGNPVTEYPGLGSTELDNPSSVVIAATKTARRLLVLNTGSAKVTAFELEAKKGK
jgi:DNA-binding beta-propeller fold protein YncE